jgi:putative oxidoreductase
MSTGLLALRVVVGVLFAMHGSGKLFGWFRAGFGAKGTAGYLEGFGFRPGLAYAYLVGASEVVAGVLFGTGFLMPLAGAIIVGIMLTAARTDHAGKGPWIFNGGWEFVLTLGTVALSAVSTGPGDVSVDSALGLALMGPQWAAASLVIGVLGAATVLVTRRAEHAVVSPLEQAA